MPSVFWVAISIAIGIHTFWASRTLEKLSRGHQIPWWNSGSSAKKTYWTDGFVSKCGILPNGHPIPSGYHWGGWKIQHDHVELLWLSHSNPWICNRNNRNNVIVNPMTNPAGIFSRNNRWGKGKAMDLEAPDGSRPNPQDWATWYCSSARGGACCILLGQRARKAWLENPPGHLVPWPRYLAGELVPGNLVA